ncbi:hypothetical protein AB0M79_27695 [Polymorphospora sp. NPDC051019]|uniref:hypothetical protein n=1 Tax=Polymorphospora sp. NPDC051019 TaxID=3155725 RepID=UPI003438CE31
MLEQTAPSKAEGTRVSVSGSAPLILLGLMLLGSFALGATTGAIPSTDTALLFSAAFYLLTVMGGLILSFLGFGILDAALRRSGDPHRAGLARPWRSW